MTIRDEADWPEVPTIYDGGPVLTVRDGITLSIGSGMTTPPLYASYLQWMADTRPDETPMGPDEYAECVRENPFPEWVMKMLELDTVME